MNTRRTARIVAVMLVASAVCLSSALAQRAQRAQQVERVVRVQRPQVSLDELVRTIPTVASSGNGIDRAEQQLTDQLQAHGAEAIPLLLPLLTHKRRSVREFVGYVLRDIDGLKEEHLDALMAARKKGNGWIPPAIGRIGTARAIEFLVHDLERRPETHTQVTYALTLAGDPAAIAIAQRFRTARREAFDECACEVFSEIGEHAAAAVGPLLDTALDGTLDIQLRQRAVSALGSCGPGAHPAATRLLSLAASDPDHFQEWVEIALLAMHSPEILPMLMRTLEGQGGSWALRELEPLGSEGFPAGPLVMKLLDDEDPDVRVEAARALGCIGYVPATGALARRTSVADDWMLAAAAVDSLVQLRATSTVDELDKVALYHWFPYVRASAQRASHSLRSTASGAMDPDPSEPEADELLLPHGLSTSAMPALEPGTDGLTPAELDRLTYTAEIATYDFASGERTTTYQRQLPGCGLKIDGGHLLGATRGEWGGEVVWVHDGVPAQTVLAENTIGLHRLGDKIVAVSGLAHMMSNWGVIYQIHPSSDGSFIATWWKRLPGAPRQSGIRADGALFVRCYGGDVVVMPSGAFEFAR